MALDAYVRVSDVRGRKGESFISPDVQREQIAAWISSRGEDLGETLVELDESGARADRPLLMKAIRRIEEGESTGLIVAKLDRFGRSLLDGLSAVARIERAGGTFVSVQDGFDLATPTGRLILRMMLAWAEWELDRIRINGDIACEKAVSRGIYIPSQGPPGYVKGDDRHLHPDPSSAPLIKEAFRRRARGASAREIAEFLNGEGMRTRTGLPFQAQTVYRLIANRAYLGESRFGRHSHLSAHQAIVDPGLWKKAQFRLRPRREPAGSLLARTVRCASCGRSMASYAPQTKRSPSATYRCYVAQRLGPRQCPSPAAVSAAELEPLVEEYAITHSGRDDLGVVWPRLTLTARRRLLAGVLDAVWVERGREPAVERVWLSGSDRASEDAWNQPVKPLDPTACNLTRIPQLASWPAAQIEDGLRGFLAAQNRWPDFAEFADAGLARLHAQAMAFGGPYWWGPRLGIQIPPRFVIWNEERVRGALRPFLRGRERFPSEGDFRDAGLFSLRRAIDKHGGLAYWAEEFGLESGSRGATWTEEMVHEQLDRLLDGRERFPTREEFRLAGKLNLFHAAKRHGGIPYWQRRFDLLAPTWSKHTPKPSALPQNELATRA